MAIQIQEDCIGLALNPTLENSTTGDPIDLTTITTITFRFLSPTVGAAVTELSGSVDGDPTLGKVICSNTNEEFFNSGNWKYQVKLVFASGQVWYSPVSKIKVKSNI